MKFMCELCFIEKSYFTRYCQMMECQSPLLKKKSTKQRRLSCAPHVPREREENVKPKLPMTECQSPLRKKKSPKKRRLSCAPHVPREREENVEPKLPPSPHPTLNSMLSQVQISDLKWEKIKRINLDLDYTLLLPKLAATYLLQTLEEQVEYFTGDLARVKVFGKWHDLPRKQV